MVADRIGFAVFNLQFQDPFKKVLQNRLFLLWRRDPVLELLLPTLLRVVLLCFAIQFLQIAL